MKLSFLPLSLLLLLQVAANYKQTHAFSSSKCWCQRRATDSNRNCIVLSAAATSQEEEEESSISVSKNRPLTPKEILARQREKQGLPADVDVHPKLYSDEILGNMRQILLTLEKRVQEGPGSVEVEEVEEFAAISQNVLNEMKQKEYERLEDASSLTSTPASTPVEPPVESSASVTTIEDPKTEEILEDGPAYDSAGGSGSLARGTTNTYIIPNMDEMSTEEYRAALQKSISDRQTKRKESGNYGNRQTWDYLNNLTGDKSGPSSKKE